MINILVLTSTFPRWENDNEPPFVFELCKQLNSAFNIHVLAPHCKNALTYEMIEGITVTRFRYFLESGETLCYEGGMLAKLKNNPTRYCLIPFFLFFQLLSAYKIIKQENITLLHAHWIIPQGITAFLLKFLLKKHITILCTSHGGDLFSLKSNAARFLKKKILQSMDGITVVNSVMKQEVSALCAPIEPCIETIPMGINLKIFNPVFKKQTPFNIIFVGRLVEKKGVEYLIHALPEILQHFPKTKLTLIGSGPIKPFLEALIYEKNLHDSVKLINAIPNNELADYYQQSQIAIFPFIVADNGDREGLPVVIAEAIACGCCIVTTDLPGIDDIATIEQGIFIVPQKDSVAISEQVLKLFYDPTLIEKCSKKALQHIQKKQSWDIIGKQYCSFINALLMQ